MSATMSGIEQAIRADEQQEIVKAMEGFFVELEQQPQTASTKLASTMVRQVAEQFFEIIRARGNK